jgi:hypothetical protein
MEAHSCSGFCPATMRFFCAEAENLNRLLGLASAALLLWVLRALCGDSFPLNGCPTILATI